MNLKDMSHRSTSIKSTNKECHKIGQRCHLQDTKPNTIPANMIYKAIR